MKINYTNTLLTAAFAALTFASCDDTTNYLGGEMMPTSDIASEAYATYDVATQSYQVGDSVLARSTTSYLGRFTDPETGTVIKSDFLAQFHCSESFGFPDSIKNDSMINCYVYLLIDKFIGDSLASFKLSVYELDKTMDPDIDYYTNIDPTKYYDTDSKPISETWYSIADYTLKDSVRFASDYQMQIRIPLPREVGQAIYDGYRKDPSQFANSETWMNSGLPCSKGLYFKLESGDGAMAYIKMAQMDIGFRYYDTYFAKDTTGYCEFAATEEVIQATRFENSGLQKLMDNTEVTYLKTPAGIFTMATLPVDQLSLTDTINSAKLTLQRYNDLVTSNFKLSIPQKVLMVRVDDYKNGFFENYNLPDGKTSFITSFNSSTNQYVFTNIAHLLSTMIEEKKAGSVSENWNKVLIIPVDATYDSSSTSSTTIVKLCHDFSMSSAKLVGGKTDAVKMEIIYTTF